MILDKKVNYAHHALQVGRSLLSVKNENIFENSSYLIKNAFIFAERSERRYRESVSFIISAMLGCDEDETVSVFFELGMKKSYPGMFFENQKSLDEKAQSGSNLL